MATQSADGLALRTDTLTPLHWAGVVLAAITGALHLYLWALNPTNGLNLTFLAAGLGFLGGIAAILVDYNRKLVYALGVPFTFGQIPAWYVVNAPEFSTLGYVDKAVQVLFVLVLVQLYRQAS